MRGTSGGSCSWGSDEEEGARRTNCKHLCPIYLRSQQPGNLAGPPPQPSKPGTPAKAVPQQQRQARSGLEAPGGPAAAAAQLVTAPQQLPSLQGLCLGKGACCGAVC